MVVHLRQCPAFRTHIAVGDGVIAVTPDTDDLIALDLYDNAAHRRADTAIAPLGSDFTLSHTGAFRVFVRSL